MVFAPHPDDETLGCGGTLARLTAAGCEVKAVLITDGGGAGGLPPGSDRIRQEEFRQALGVLGVTDVEGMNYPDGAFEADPAFENEVRTLLSTYRPEWVFLPSPLDYHRDHVRASAALEPICMESDAVTLLLFYEIWAPGPATHVVDITDHVGQKQAALNRHATALACGDYARAMEGLNRYRGLYLGWNKSAEAFWVEPTGSGGGLFAQVKRLATTMFKRMET